MGMSGYERTATAITRLFLTPRQGGRGVLKFLTYAFPNVESEVALHV